MTLGLPAYVVPRSASASLTRGFTSVALVCLLAAFLLVEAQQIAVAGSNLWPALLALVPLAVLAYRFHNNPSPVFAATYLLVGTICVFAYSVVVLSNFSVQPPSNVFPITLLKVALILTAGPSRTLAGSVSWMGAGFVLGESAARAAAVVVGNPIKIDVAAFTLFVGVLGLRIMSLIASERNARVQQRLDRAAQDEELFLVREGVELRASALLHDTVLNNLAAISSSPAGPPSGQLRKGVQHDIEMLVREDWWGEAAKSVNATSSAEWQFSALNASIELMRDMGLAVDVTGDIEVIERLSVEQSATVALAVHQCLVNVMKHAETGKAELVLAESDQEVSVMVVDGGRGFVLANSHGDRLGLRQSVRRRIEAVGGSVRVWSTPGRGTSIVIRIPVDGDST